MKSTKYICIIYHSSEMRHRRFQIVNIIETDELQTQDIWTSKGQGFINRGTDLVLPGHDDISFRK